MSSLCPELAFRRLDTSSRPLGGDEHAAKKMTAHEHLESQQAWKGFAGFVAPNAIILFQIV
jgi:hypothetical protein